MKKKHKHRFKKTLLFLLILSMIASVTCVPMNANATENTTDFAGGKGTAESPYLISTANHVDNIRKYPSAHYELTDNIVFSSNAFDANGEFYNEGMGWQPIDEFTGVLNGKGYTIRNVKSGIAFYNSGFLGLFAYNNGVIANLNVVADFDVETVSESTNDIVGVGLIAGVNDENGLIVNCSVEGYCSSYAVNSAFAGGITGINFGVIRNCTNKASVAAVSTSYAALSGGIAGSTYNMIERCSNTGSASAVACNEGSQASSGGIAGALADGYIERSYNKGNSTANAAAPMYQLYGTGIAGGIAGTIINLKGYVRSCYNEGKVQSSSLGAVAYSGGIAGVSSGTIWACYNGGNVYNNKDGCNDQAAGGIVGLTDGKVYDVYNYGDVSHTCYAGGIASIVAGGSMTDGYNVGNVGPGDVVFTGKPYYVGGIAVIKDSGTISDFLFVPSGTYGNTGIFQGGPKGATWISEENLQIQANISGLDFSSTWTMEGKADYSYPELKSTFRTKLITGISVNTLPNKTVYKDDESFDKAGMTVYVNYEDGTSELIENYTVKGFDNTKEGQVKICIEYDYHRAYFDVTVELSVLTGIKITFAPSRVNYPLGMELDKSGLTVKGLYGESTEKTLTEYTVTGYDSSKLGEQTITVESGGFSDTFTVNVFDPAETVIKGDTNADLSVTNKDAIYLLYSIMFEDEAEYPLYQLTDYNGDGSVTVDDAIYLLYHVLFPDDYILQ